MTTRRNWTIAIFGYVALFGAALQLRGALFPSIGETFDLGEGELGLLASLGSAGFLVTVLAVGMMANRISVKPVLFGGLLAMTAAFVVIASAPTYVVLLAGFLLVGTVQGCLNGLDRPLLSHLYPSNRGRIYNRQEMVWAVGATLGPLLAIAALAASDLLFDVTTLSIAGWRLGYYALAVTLLPVAILVWRLEVPGAGSGPGLDGERTLSRSDLGGLLRTPAVGTMGGLILLLSLVESGMFTWLPYYLARTLPEAVASLSLSIYLAAYIPGRYAFSVAATRMDNLALVLVSAFVATGLLVVFVLVSGYAAIGVVFVVGFLVSGLFPTLLAWATNVVPEYSGPVNALAFGASSTGFMIFPATMGVVAEHYGMARAMGLLAVAMGLFTVVAAARFLGQRRRLPAGGADAGDETEP